MSDVTAGRRDALGDFVERVRGLARRDLLDAAAVEAVDALAAAGVDALLLKGPALARFLYTEGETRSYWDVDLLVAPSGLLPARRELAGLGYKNFSDELGIHDVAGVVHAEAWSRRAKGGPLVIDLHRRIPGSRGPADAAWRILASRRAWIELSGHRVPVLDREGLALQLATHAAQHGPGDLKAMGDLARGIERWPRERWRAAAGLAHELQATDAFAAGLRLVPAGAELAGELQLPPTDRLTWAILHRDARPRGTFHLQALAQAQSGRERLDVLRRSLIPKSKWIAWQHPWVAGSRLRLAAAYGVHLVRAPVWAARAWWFRRRERRLYR